MNVAVKTDLTAEPAKDLLRFLTCGSVDDGKSTLIGRLLHDSKLIFEDQLSTLAKDSVKHGTTGEEIDFALLVDGLEAEREQGITIDVAYRFFSTARRAFIVADTPGHAQYTRNMATGASTAELAILLVDARKGLLEQTRRHAGAPCHRRPAAHSIDAVSVTRTFYPVIQLQRDARTLKLVPALPVLEATKSRISSSRLALRR